MRIGLIDVDSHNFPNIPLMKLSAWHKSKGDEVEMYMPLISGHVDRVYMSKVFSFSKDYEWVIDADEIVRGGTGYAIRTVNGIEVFGEDKGLPNEVEHTMPDYTLYGITDRAYGFLTRGCPRGCSFCHVASKEGRCSTQVADIGEFWNGQPKIELCDPNILACKDWKKLLKQLADTKAKVSINQGLDIRLIDDEKVDALMKINLDKVHFAWDNPKDNLEDKFRNFATKYKGIKNQHGTNGTVYCLVNFNSSMEENLYRIYKLREMNFQPFVMIYDKEHSGKEVRRLARWCNNPFIFWKCDKFEDYKSEAR